ncbi:hypothetical protein HELRODRAFT_75625, partial [Helobdella robusta]|uniref:Piwi-like protein 1 n=1 Tax=Helobdella robusta TaxID=6412 RepID=T1G277_HELRO
TGLSGTRLTICTNLFNFQRKSESAFFQYHVDFVPDIPNIRVRKYLLKTVEKHLGIDSCNQFDGSILFTSHRIDDKVCFHFCSCRSGEDIKISIRYTNAVPYTSPMVLQIYNLIFKKFVLREIGLQIVGRNYFNPQAGIDIRELGLKVWPGYFTSILEYDEGINLMVDICHKVLGQETVLDILYNVRKLRPRSYVEDSKRDVVGKIVLTRYNNRTYRVDDIDWRRTPMDTFPMRDGTTQMSFKEYYRTRHHIDLLDDTQPLLLSVPSRREKRAGQDGPICLIPELCIVTGISDEIKSNFHSMRELSTHTRLGPHERSGKIEQLHQQIRRSQNAMKDLANWNLSLNPNLLTIEARTLEAEQIFLGIKGSARENPKVCFSNADWSRDMRALNLLTPIRLERWAMVIPKRRFEECQNFFTKLVQAGQMMGVKIEEPEVYDLNDESNRSYIQTLEKFDRKDYQLVMCVLESEKKDKYDVIKKTLCINVPIPSQVMLMKTLRKQPGAVLSVATKVVIQVNCKVGGEGWAVSIPAMKYSMVIGIDTYHDSSKKYRSVVGIVGSTNSSFTKYHTTWAFQEKGEEVSSCLCAAIASLVKAFTTANGGNRPGRIFVYRDGVGDGQLGMVYDHELLQIQEGCKDENDPKYKPKITLFVVKKRVNNRFFAFDKNRRANPPPGTVIDTKATRPHWYDFFLISQSVNQGTVTPTHYNILHDDSGLKPDHLQRLTYKLCHLYFNWQGTVRVPAPCQYAHKVAFLIGQSLHESPSNTLANKLFYL